MWAFEGYPHELIASKNINLKTLSFDRSTSRACEYVDNHRKCLECIGYFLHSVMCRVGMVGCGQFSIILNIFQITELRTADHTANHRLPTGVQTSILVGSDLLHARL